jgi:hypothetical protein
VALFYHKARGGQAYENVRCGQWIGLLALHKLLIGLVCIVLLKYAIAFLFCGYENHLFIYASRKMRTICAIFCDVGGVQLKEAAVR